MAKSVYTFLLCAALLMGAGLPAFGQVYSWEDENGKKHYGDRIPPQYQDQASEYEMGQINSSDTVVPQARPMPSSSSHSRAAARPDSYKPTAANPAGSARPAPNRPQSCVAQREAYREAQECWARCRQPGAGTINVGNSACVGCQNLKKPSC